MSSLYSYLKVNVESTKSDSDRSKDPRELIPLCLNVLIIPRALHNDARNTEVI
jgi:hypothetical protein